MRRLTWLASVISLAAAFIAGCDAPSAPTATPARSSSQPNVESSDVPQTETPTIEVHVEAPNSDSPFTAGAAITPAQVRPGETVTFVVRGKTADTWHIYAVDRPSGVGIQTKLELDLPDGIVAAGEWANPEAEAYAAGGDCFIYHSDFLFHRQLTIADDAAPGPVEVKCEFGYQTCNDSMCLPPTTMELSAKLEIVSN